MKTQKQIFRQPTKYFAGILLIAMAVAILITCVEQYSASVLTRAGLENQYNTIALTTEQFQGDYVALPTEYVNWIEQTASEHPELVECISDTGLLSAYIPEMKVDNYTQHYLLAGNSVNLLGVPYNCAALIITMDEVGTDISEQTMLVTCADGSVASHIRAVTIECKGTVEKIIALEEGYRSPVGYSIDLTITAQDTEALDALDLIPGEAYLVFGMDYADHDWELRRAVSVDEANFQNPFDISRVYETHPLGEEFEINGRPGNQYTFYYYENTTAAGKSYVAFADYLLSYARSCSLTVCDYASLPDEAFLMDENNNFLGFEVYMDQRILREDENSDGFLQVGTTLVDAATYMEMYSVPTIARLSESADELLQTDLWKKALESCEINNHTFPVLAVEKLGYQADFARQQARIVSGRDFTQTELENGEKVCILSETLAAANGLSVGDTISLQAFSYDPNVNETIATYPQTTYPHASYYSSARGFSNEAEQYTIVGLYRKGNSDDSTNSYGFSSNTVFIPKTAASAKMAYGTQGVFRTIVLHNGQQEAFEALVEEMGYAGLFVYYDQGYAHVVDGLTEFEKVTGKLILAGLAAYAAIMLLYVLLFPVGQKRELAIMEGLGARTCQKVSHIMMSGIFILFPGTLFGALGSVALQNTVTAGLISTIGIELPLVFHTAAITVITAAAQLGVMLLVLLAAGLFLSLDKAYDRGRRGRP
ncbi:MAG: ABC transporter permease [Firmicutes bacterium]|nr:ABC transporter permease [Bacillota bacterium]